MQATTLSTLSVLKTYNKFASFACDGEHELALRINTRIVSVLFSSPSPVGLKSFWTRRTRVSRFWWTTCPTPKVLSCKWTLTPPARVQLYIHFTPPHPTPHHITPYHTMVWHAEGENTVSTTAAMKRNLPPQESCLQCYTLRRRRSMYPAWGLRCLHVTPINTNIRPFCYSRWVLFVWCQMSNQSWICVCWGCVQTPLERGINIGSDLGRLKPVCPYRYDMDSSDGSTTLESEKGRPTEKSLEDLNRKIFIGR